MTALTTPSEDFRRLIEKGERESTPGKKKNAAWRAFERAVKARLEEIGYWCIRAAGSKGEADVVAIKGRPRNEWKGGSTEVLLVQCKYSSVAKPGLSHNERIGLEDLAAVLQATPVYAYNVPRVPGKRMNFENLNTGEEMFQ